LAAVEADFFDASNQDAQRQRELLAEQAQDDMYQWLNAQDGTRLCWAW
jgi:hypothetical protein